MWQFRSLTKNIRGSTIEKKMNKLFIGGGSWKVV